MSGASLICLIRHIHLVEPPEAEWKCEETGPKNQFEAFEHQHRNLYRRLSRASAQVTLHGILLGVSGVIYNPSTAI
eukprot:602694-Pelagomonas_calceolata.AAC.6